MGVKHSANFFKSAPQSPSACSDSLDALLQRQKTVQQNYLTLQSQLHEIQEERTRIERALQEALRQQSTKSFTSQDGTIVATLIPTPSRVIIDSEEHIPLEYVYCFMRRQLDMQRLETDLKQGKKIPGAHLGMDEAVEVRAIAEKSDVPHPDTTVEKGINNKF